LSRGKKETILFSQKENRGKKRRHSRNGRPGGPCCPDQKKKKKTPPPKAVGSKGGRLHDAERGASSHRRRKKKFSRAAQRGGTPGHHSRGGGESPRQRPRAHKSGEGTLAFQGFPLIFVKGTLAPEGIIWGLSSSPGGCLVEKSSFTAGKEGKRDV